MRIARVKEAFECRPPVDLGPCFFAVAVKEGASEWLHLDYSDDLEFFAWVVAVGDWTGGEFCAPQLGVKFPIRPGQVLAVRARYLAHCSSPLVGRRVVFTCFAEATLLKRADREALERDGAVYLSE